MKTILEYLKQKSTWLGITTVLTSIGVALNPDQIEAISMAGAGLVGLILTFWNDKK